MKSKFLPLALFFGLATFSSCNLFDKDTDEDETIIVSFENGQFMANDCSELGNLNSPTGTLATNIYFENETGESLKIYWVNFTGELTLYKGNLTSGSSHRQQTYLEHPWYVTTSDEACVKIVTAVRPGVTDTVRFSK